MTSVTTTGRRVLADLAPRSQLGDVALVIGGAVLTGLCAQVSVHTSLSPVPFTLQTLAVLLTGAALGSVRGASSMVLYTVAGGIGLPWFANGASGWGGPSFGYIIGFVAAAALVGELGRRGQDRHIVSTIGMMALGSAVIYVFGATWLALDLHLSASRAVLLGVVPFLIFDCIKVAAGSLILPFTWRAARAVGKSD